MSNFVHFIKLFLKYQSPASFSKFLRMKFGTKAMYNLISARDVGSQGRINLSTLS